MNFLKSRIGLVVVFVAFLILLGVSTTILKGKKIDLTENQLYTLSDGTINVLRGLGNDVELTLYFSNKATKELPALRTYEQRVEDVLKEFVELSNGRIRFRVVDPEPFSEAQDEAAAAGLQGVPVGVQGDEIYFGLVGKRVGEKKPREASTDSDSEDTNSVEQVIPFFQLDKEDFLEYDLAKLVYSLDHPEPPTIGIISSLKLNGGMNFMTRQQDPAWVITEQLKGLFNLKWLSQDEPDLSDKNIDILLVIHPTGVSDKTKLAIDQFVLGGGRALVFVDPYSEVEKQSMGMMGGGSGSDLPELFKSWGVEYDNSKFVGDYENSMVVSLSGGRQPVRHIGLLGLTKNSFKQDDVILSGLETMNFSSAGFFRPIEGHETKIVPLIKTSPKAMAYEASILATLANPEDLLNDFKPAGEPFILAARISGPASTAFPNGIEVEEEVKSEGDNTDVSEGESDAKPKEPEKIKKTYLPKKKSAENIQVMVIADTDVLSDRLWVQVQQFFGQQIVSPWANNGDFLVNAVDNFAGNADLISVRSRGQFSRSFTRVQALKLKAEEKFRAQQEALQAELAETDKKLSELEQSKGAAEKATLSDEQQKAILDFQKKKLSIRKKLRDVQHQLDKDIEALGTRLKLINILLTPLLLTLGVFLWRGWRSRRMV